MPTVYTEVEVDVELSDFDTYDLIEELEKRGETIADHKEILEEMYDAYRVGNREVIDRHLRDMFYEVLGRIA